jgi:hypothetical protein
VFKTSHGKKMFSSSFVELAGLFLSRLWRTFEPCKYKAEYSQYESQYAVLDMLAAHSGYITWKEMGKRANRVSGVDQTYDYKNDSQNICGPNPAFVAHKFLSLF